MGTASPLRRFPGVTGHFAGPVIPIPPEVILMPATAAKEPKERIPVVARRLRHAVDEATRWKTHSSPTC